MNAPYVSVQSGIHSGNFPALTIAYCMNVPVRFNAAPAAEQFFTNQISLVFTKARPVVYYRYVLVDCGPILPHS